MSTDAANGSFRRPGTLLDPVELARRDLGKALPRRFYTEAAVDERDGAFVVVLDGRKALSPARAALALPTRAAAEALAAEWAAQGETIDPASMPLTRIVNAALDGVALRAEAVRADIVKYAESDLLCYRAAEPDALVAAQRAAWDPVLAWARAAHGIELKLAVGVVFVAQPDAALTAVAQLVGAISAPVPLACLHVMTDLTGSVLLALALAHRRLSVAEAWAAAHVDEDFQMRIWGIDVPAMERRAARERDVAAAARLLDLIRPD
jgi:chaperone required for assembly of F1-ATPase